MKKMPIPEKKKDSYDHLNDDMDVPFTMKQLAEWIVKQNYGCVRFLSALIDARRNCEKHSVGSSDVLADEIERLIEEGYF